MNSRLERNMYDSLFFFVPFVLKAKLIQQELCKLQPGSDDKIPDEIAMN